MLTDSSKVVHEPPEGVLAGENVPRENEAAEQTEHEHEQIEDAMTVLRTRGEPWASMRRERLRAKATDLLATGAL